MSLRPSFRKGLKIFVATGLCIVGGFYFYAFVAPHIHLPNLASRGCPILAQLHPLSHDSIQPGDSLELVDFTFAADPYVISIHGDGTLTRDTTYSLIPDWLPTGCPLHGSDKRLAIPQETARSILTKARDGGFCRLCQLYQPRHDQPDTSAQLLTLTFNGRTTRVFNNAGNPPAIFHQLADSILALAPMPDYARKSNLTPQRTHECQQFQMQQMLKMRNSRHLP